MGEGEGGLVCENLPSVNTTIRERDELSLAPVSRGRGDITGSPQTPRSLWVTLSRVG